MNLNAARKIHAAAKILANTNSGRQTIQSELDQIHNRIDYCEQHINEIVYKVYGLTKEEIALVESA